MVGTSLQNIIIDNTNQNQKWEIRDLFLERQYALFETSQLKNKTNFIHIDKYRYFVQILDDWNKNVLAKTLNNSNQYM